MKLDPTDRYFLNNTHISYIFFKVKTMLSLKAVILVSFMLFSLGNLMPGKKFLVETEDADEGESIGE